MSEKKSVVAQFVDLHQRMRLEFKRPHERECAVFVVAQGGSLTTNVQNTVLTPDEALELGRWLVEVYA